MSNKDKEKVLLEEPVSAGTQAALSAPRYTPGKYTPSDKVTGAAEALEKHNVQSPEQYKSKWQEKIDGTVDKILNREEFSYDVNGDALYKQYADQYARNGKTAMEDTIARASAMTGGYGNSYAQTAGQAAYAGEMQKLNDVIPELYQMALDKYTREGETLRDNYAMLTDAENTEYSRHRDGVNDYLTERDYLTGVYNNERNFDYGKWSDTQDAQRYAFGVNSDNYWKRVDLEREDEATQYERGLEAAYAAAELGEFSALAELLDIDEAAAEERYQKDRENEDRLTALDIEAAQLGIDADRYNLNAAMTSATKDAAYENALVQAAIGNYKALAKYYNITEEQAATLYTSMGDGGNVDEKELYGGYTQKEFRDALMEYFNMGEEETAYIFAKSIGTNEAMAIYESMFGKDETGGPITPGYTYSQAPITNNALPTFGGGSYRNAKFDFDKSGGVLDRTTWEDAKASNNQSKVIRGYESYDTYIEVLASQLVEQGWSADEAMEWAAKYLEG